MRVSDDVVGQCRGKVKGWRVVAQSIEGAGLSLAL